MNTGMHRMLTRSCRTHHTQLNQLILSRLPSCLPPAATHPSPYAFGLLHFAPIYSAFEAAWQLLSDFEPTSELSLETAVVLSSLIHLHNPSLLRTDRLRQDLALLLQQPAELIDVRLRHPDSRQAREFVRHIRDVACYKPHALIAYTWVMYMALFNGGKWIREQLSVARDLTWVLNQDAVELAAAFTGGSDQTEVGLSFWHFESKDDGDDIKAEYKARLAEVGTMLSPNQKADIVHEANEIFERCINLVGEIDRTLSLGSKDHPFDVATMREADSKRDRPVVFLRKLSDSTTSFGFLLFLIAFLLWTLLTIRSPFQLIRPILDSH